MKYAVTSQEMRIYDRNTSDIFGIAGDVLMERASLKVVDRIEDWIKERQCERRYRAVIFAGIGNNGGDGAVVARLLKQRGYLVTLVVVGDPTKTSDLLLKQLKICERYGIITDTFSNVRGNLCSMEWDIIVDALFGIGLSRNVTGTYKDVIDYIASCKEAKKSDLLVASIDIPSGINADNGQILGTAVKADFTVTFNHVKLGEILYPGCEYVGQLFVEDAGITNDSFCGKEPAAFYFNEKVTALLPTRKKDANKGTNGKVLIIAGSKNISGACILAASACLRSGAGMVKVLTAVENSEIVKSLLPEVLIDCYDDFEPVAEKVIANMEWADTVVIGPGIGIDMKGDDLVRVVLESCDKSLVMDADALNLVALNSEYRKMVSNYTSCGKKLVLTPHLAEFARLFGRGVKECKENILQYPKELAKELNCTVICKDARTVISDSNEKKIYINVSGNDGMATAGSGDVLAGIVGALLCQESSFMSACLGAYIHGVAGDNAAEKHGKYAMVASDIATELEDILR
jgi:NAD(P)H-hydrate epimerase